MYYYYDYDYGNGAYDWMSRNLYIFEFCELLIFYEFMNIEYKHVQVLG